MRSFWGTLVWISAGGMVFFMLSHVLWHAGFVIPGADLVLGNTLVPLGIIHVFSGFWGGWNEKVQSWPPAECPWWVKLVAYITPWYMALFLFVYVILRLWPMNVKNLGFVSAMAVPYYAAPLVMFSAKLARLMRNQSFAQ